MHADSRLRPPAQRHSPTSCDAAEAIVGRAGSVRRRVLEAIRSSGSRGLTDEQLQDALQLNPSTARPRRIELVELGLVRDSGRTRPTASGRMAAVWVACWPGQQLELIP